PLPLLSISAIPVRSAVRRSEPVRSVLRATHDALSALSRSVRLRLSVLEWNGGRGAVAGEVACSVLRKERSAEMSNNVRPVDEQEFEQQVLRSDSPVLVDFWAPWCSPCLRMAPVFDAAAARHAGAAVFFKVNIDDNPSLIGRHGIQSIPTLILFKG